MIIKVLLSLILAGSIIYDIQAQILQITDYKISTDDKPSSIIQNSPKLFFDGSKRFITTWKDYRDGLVSTYAQWFDSSGSAVDNNIKISSDEKIAFLEDGSFMVLKEEGYTAGIDAYIVNIWGSSYDKNNNELNTFSIIDYADFTFWDPALIRSTYDISAYSDGYIFFSANPLHLFKYTPDGTLTADMYTELLPAERSIKTALAVNKNDEYSIAYFNIIDVSGTQDDLIGISALFFSAQDSLMKNVIIDTLAKPAGYTWLRPEEAPAMDIIIIQDSLFQIFWIHKDSATLNAAVYNSSGNQTGSVQKFNLLHKSDDTAGEILIENFAVSNVRDDQYALLISLLEGNDDSSTAGNTIFYFDGTGNVIDSIANNTDFVPVGEQVYYRGNKEFFTVSESNNDIMLNELKDFSFTELAQINDDQEGSNETNPFITEVDSNTIFVTWYNEAAHHIYDWKNEQYSYGQKMSIYGTRTGDPIKLKGFRSIFSADGNCLNLWKIPISDDSVIVGYTIYDPEWNIVEDVILTTSDYPHLAESSVTKMSDSLYILYFRNRNTVYVRTLDKNFNSIKEKYWQDLDVMDPFRIIKETDTSFWIYWIPSSVQLYDNEMNTISQKYPLYFDLYLGNNEFLHTQNNYAYGYPFNREDLQGQVFSLDRNTLVEYAYLASRAEDFRLSALPDNNFLVMWQRNNDQLFARAFNNRGAAKADSFLIHSDIKSYKKHPAVLVKNGKLFFAWSDARNSGRGYDIYGSTFELSKVVEVGDRILAAPVEFHLSQNYPNPFNPSTTIKYSLPEKLNVQIKVFDILGREAAVLVNEEKPAGEYTANFNASYLPSGVYIYKITAGNLTYSRKMVLLK